jgi:hypothetical protein
MTILSALRRFISGDMAAQQSSLDASPGADEADTAAAAVCGALTQPRASRSRAAAAGAVPPVKPSAKRFKRPRAPRPALRQRPVEFDQPLPVCLVDDEPFEPDDAESPSTLRLAGVRPVVGQAGIDLPQWRTWERPPGFSAPLYHFRRPSGYIAYRPAKRTHRDPRLEPLTPSATLGALIDAFETAGSSDEVCACDVFYPRSPVAMRIHIGAGKTVAL